MNSIWMNRGSLIAPGALSDRGFSLGYRVMTTMLVVKGHIFDFDRHMDRLERHAAVVGLAEAIQRSNIRFEIEGAWETKRPSYAICRVYITAGSGELTQAITASDTWIQLESIEQERLRGEPVKLDLQSEVAWRRGEHIKTGLYPHALPQLSKARRLGFGDVLWCNGDQEIAECTTANIFLIGRDGDLVEIATPPETSGILLGITRSRIMDLLNQAKIPVTERIIYREELPRFDEAFKSSSISGIVPVTEIGSHKLHSQRPNSVVSHVQRLWNAWFATQGSDSPSITHNA